VASVCPDVRPNVRYSALFFSFFFFFTNIVGRPKKHSVGQKNSWPANLFFFFFFNNPKCTFCFNIYFTFFNIEIIFNLFYLTIPSLTISHTIIKISTLLLNPLINNPYINNLFIDYSFTNNPLHLICQTNVAWESWDHLPSTLQNKQNYIICE